MHSTSLQDLEKIVAQLRAENGCPWDRKQTAQSLKKYLLEEADELAEAIDKEDDAHICEELGDLFYILTMLISVHEDKESFSHADVFDGICKKMIRRHPHVFAGKNVSSDADLRKQWEEIKKGEKRGD